MFIDNRRSLLAGLFLVATAAMSDGASAAKVSAILEGDLRASQLQALGTRWVVASKSAGQVAVYVPPSAGSTGATLRARGKPGARQLCTPPRHGLR